MTLNGRLLMGSGVLSCSDEFLACKPSVASMHEVISDVLEGALSKETIGPGTASSGQPQKPFIKCW